MRVAANVKQTPDQLAQYLERNGSIAQLAAPPDRGRDRLAAAAARQDRERSRVGDDEVKAVIDKLNASKGTEEYHVGEIFLSADPGDRSADDRQRQQDPRAAQAAAPPSPAMRANFRRLRRRRSAATSAGSAPNSFPRRSPRRSGRCAPGRSATRSRFRAAFRSSPSRTRARSSPPIRATRSSA